MCVEAPLLASGAAQHEHGSDCERLCPLPEPAASAGDESDCSMSVDNSLIVMSSAVAVYPAQQPVHAGHALRHEFNEPTTNYFEPGLAQPNPPPEA